MKPLNVKIKLLTDTATCPTKATEESAGYDIYADIAEPVTIPVGETRLFPTGFAIELPKYSFAGLYARSGLATKRGLRLSNCTSVIDADYRGEVKVALYNDSVSPQTINPQDRIAQMIVHKLKPTTIEIVDKLGETARGEGGFGSTGINKEEK